jgi:hypothetical protein
MKGTLSMLGGLAALCGGQLALEADETATAAAVAKAEIEEANRRVVVTMYNLLMNDHKVDEALELIDSRYIQHNVRVPDGKEFLRGAFKERFAEHPQLRSDIKRTIARSCRLLSHAEVARNLC